MLSEKVARYFIIGGAGFIGSHLVDRLVKIGKVTVYDNLSSGSLKFIGHHLERGNFNFTRADLRDFNTLKQATAGHDVVFHLAANPEVKTGTQTTDLGLKTGIIASYSVLEAMRLNQIKKVLFTFSSAVYGDVGVTLVSEDHGPLLPISLTARASSALRGLSLHSITVRYAGLGL